MKKTAKTRPSKPPALYAQENRWVAARVKGTENETRWIAELGFDGGPVKLDDRVVIVNTKLAFDARALARIHFSRSNAPFSLVEQIQVAPFRANGHLPPKVVLVEELKGSNGTKDITFECYDFEEVGK